MEFEYNPTANTYSLHFLESDIPREYRGSISFRLSEESSISCAFVYSRGGWTGVNNFSYDPNLTTYHERWKPTRKGMKFQKKPPTAEPFRHHKDAILQAEGLPESMKPLVKKALEAIISQD